MDKIELFLIKTNMYRVFCKFCIAKTLQHCNENIIHSDRWSMVYDWVHDGRFEGQELPNEIETILTQIWETQILHLNYN